MQFSFKSDAEEVAFSDDCFYALCNGYLNPEEHLVDQEQINAVRRAETVLTAYFEQLRDQPFYCEM